MVRGRRGRRGSSSEAAPQNTPQTEAAADTDSSGENGAVGGQQPIIPQVTVAIDQVPTDQTMEDRLTAQDRLLSSQDARLGRMETLLQDLADRRGSDSRGSKKRHQSSPRRGRRSRSARPSSTARQASRARKARSPSNSSVSSMSDKSVSRSPSPKKSKPFSQANFLDRHEKCDSFDKLMLVNIRTVNKTIDQGNDAQPILDHMEMLCVKAATKIYVVRALIDFDKAVRDRANLKGISAFKNIETSDMLAYFSYDNTIVAVASRSKPKTTNKNGDNIRSCFAFNRAIGCSSQNCRYKHMCMFCKSSSHGSYECKMEGKMPTNPK